MMNDVYYIPPKPDVTEADRAILKKAKAMESALVKNGWKWVDIDKRTSVLVPCDKSGNPTKKGAEMIERLMSSVSIK